MVIDGAKGVEPRTIKLMEVCRLRDTPIITFINKLDREIRDPIEVLDEIEDILQIQCAPMNWPIGMGQQFKGIYELAADRLVCFEKSQGHHIHAYRVIEGLDSDEARELLGWITMTLSMKSIWFAVPAMTLIKRTSKRPRSVPSTLVRPWAILAYSKCWMDLSNWRPNPSLGQPTID